jgi:nucleotide-binding universal stress UspA family protein
MDEAVLACSVRKLTEQRLLQHGSSAGSRRTQPQEGRQHFKEMQLEVKHRAAKAGVAMTTLLIEGRETMGILEAAKTTHADLRVVGLCRHATNVELAGTVRRIANECPCPILAVSAC